MGCVTCGLYFAIVVYSSDNKFVIKTLKKAELNFLLQTKCVRVLLTSLCGWVPLNTQRVCRYLQDYYYHLTQHPESRLCRFYGCVGVIVNSGWLHLWQRQLLWLSFAWWCAFRVYTLTVKGSEYHFIVMNNVLYSKDHDILHKVRGQPPTTKRCFFAHHFFLFCFAWNDTILLYMSSTDSHSLIMRNRLLPLCMRKWTRQHDMCSPTETVRPQGLDERPKRDRCRFSERGGGKRSELWTPSPPARSRPQIHVHEPACGRCLVFTSERC